jgi:hypothetical protein
MVCEGLESLGVGNQTLSNLLSYPTTCVPQFWTMILVSFFIVVTFLIIFFERERVQKVDWWSSMGVSALATIFVTIGGSIAGFIPRIIVIQIVVAGMLLIAIWMFKR